MTVELTKFAPIVVLASISRDITNRARETDVSTGACGDVGALTRELGRADGEAFDDILALADDLGFEDEVGWSKRVTIIKDAGARGSSDKNSSKDTTLTSGSTGTKMASPKGACRSLKTSCMPCPDRRKKRRKLIPGTQYPGGKCLPSVGVTLVALLVLFCVANPSSTLH